MVIVPLAWERLTGMTVHAARMLENNEHPIEIPFRGAGRRRLGENNSSAR
jgi:hypothetical protein